MRSRNICCLRNGYAVVAFDTQHPGDATGCEYVIWNEQSDEDKWLIYFIFF